MANAADLNPPHQIIFKTITQDSSESLINELTECYANLRHESFFSHPSAATLLNVQTKSHDCLVKKKFVKSNFQHFSQKNWVECAFSFWQTKFKYTSETFTIKTTPSKDGQPKIVKQGLSKN